VTQMAIRNDIRVPTLLKLYDYWNAKRRGRRFPARADLDPTEMSFVLGYVDLIDVEPGDPPVFRFRLCGTKTDVDDGFTMQGKTIDEYPLPSHRATARAAYLHVIATGEPFYQEIERSEEGRFARFARLVLPLSSNGKAVDMLCMARMPLPPDRVMARRA
jgi:hypothetical protein